MSQTVSNVVYRLGHGPLASNDYKVIVVVRVPHIQIIPPFVVGQPNYCYAVGVDLMPGIL